MTETWRRKSYYTPRVLIDVGRVLSPEFPDSLLCLTGAQQELLRNLTQYLHRRSTFVSEYHDGFYLGPDNDDWDELQAIVAELEETLMGCQEFTDLLESVLACVCQSAALQQHDAYLGPGTQEAIDKYMTDGGLQVEDTYGGTVPADGERCAIAQLTFATAYEFLTEYTAPLSSALVAIVLPAAMAALATMIGATVIGIPVATLILVLTGLIELWTLGALENVKNEYEAYKEELVCALYRGLDTDYMTAQNNAVAVIAEMNIGPTDKVLLHTMVAPWLIQLAKRAYDNGTAWALANVEAGYCDECDILQGGDWFAQYVGKVDGLIEIHHIDNPSWVAGCFENWPTIPGYTVCGCVFEVEEITGCDVLKRMSPYDCSCTGDGMWGNTSEALEELVYFAVEGYYIDEVECKATLAPGSTTLANVLRLTGKDYLTGGWQLGWACGNETATVRVKWVVYEGTYV